MTTEINSLAALKRYCKTGTVLTMVSHDWYPTGKLIGVSRKIIKVQTNAIALASDTSEHGSWLQWPKASSMSFHPNGFSVSLDDTTDAKMVYSYE